MEIVCCRVVDLDRDRWKVPIQSFLLTPIPESVLEINEAENFRELHVLAAAVRNKGRLRVLGAHYLLHVRAVVHVFSCLWKVWISSVSFFAEDICGFILFVRQTWIRCVFIDCCDHRFDPPFEAEKTGII